MDIRVELEGDFKKINSYEFFYDKTRKYYLLIQVTA